MSIEKKSLISTLKTTKKANVAKEDLHAGVASASIKSPARLMSSKSSLKSGKASLKSGKASLKSGKSSLKSAKGSVKSSKM